MDGSLAPQTASVVLPDWVPRRALDVDAVARMVEDGVLSPEERVELIGGQLVAVSPQGLPHMGCIAALNEIFVRNGTAKVWVQMSLRLDRLNQPEPDLALLRRRPDDYRLGEPPTGADALLVIEVSQTTLRYDRGVKAELYGSFGLPEFWVVDLPGRAVIVHREPSAKGYRSVVPAREGEALRPLALPDLDIPVALILGPAAP